MGSHGNTGAIAFGLFILLWGVTWLGNDMGWWDMNFPFWPVLVIAFAIGMLYKALKK